MEPNNVLHVRLAPLARRVLSARSAHAPAAIFKLGAIVLLALPLAVLAGVVHGATGARAMSTSAAHRATGSTGATGALSLAAPLHVRVSVASRRLDTLEGHPLHVRGTLRPALARQLVVLQIRHGGRWHTVAHARTGGRGRFALRYVPREPTTLAVRVATRAATRRLGLMNVYRQVDASWYGGGGSLACGGELTSSTLGVASKTLPCGTLVTLRYRGRSVRVPVVDRGPYVPGREFDLTEATKQALGFGDTGMLWSTR